MRVKPFWAPATDYRSIKLKSSIFWEVSPNRLGFELIPGNVPPAPRLLWSCPQNPSSPSERGCTTHSIPQKRPWWSWTQEPGNVKTRMGENGRKILSCHPIPRPGTTPNHPERCKPPGSVHSPTNALHTSAAIRQLLTLVPEQISWDMLFVLSLRKLRGLWSQWSCDSSAETLMALTFWTHTKNSLYFWVPFSPKKKSKMAVRWLWGHCEGGCAFRSRCMWPATYSVKHAAQYGGCLGSFRLLLFWI